LRRNLQSNPNGTTEEEVMAESQMTVTPEELQYLLDLLEVKFKDTRVEERRTRTPTYPAHILREGEMLVVLPSKLRPEP
jgi:hypothetical protein